MKKYEETPLGNSKVEEPVSVYFTESPSMVAMSFNNQSFIKMARKGVERKRLDALIAYLDMDLEQISQLLGVSSRTLMRKSASDQLNIHISQQAILLMMLVQKGIQVFGTRIDFNDWLRTPITALGGDKPINYLDTSFGINELMNVLGRIEYGVYA
ncbi:MAG: DUF2384 domain-containing protein [Chitinophagales bacterium]|nr:DUF2384 domain-containing protein [Chitinophagales bacterium]